MNFGKAFTYIFDDPDWFNKLIVPVLVGLIPLLGQLVVTGYMLDLTRNVSNRSERPLPELDFGRQLGRGFRWWVITLLYSLPMIVIALLMAIPSAAMSDSNGLKFTIAVIFVILFGILLFVFGLALALFLPAAQATFAIKDDIKSALDFKSIIGMVRNNYTAWLLVIGGAILAGIIAPLGTVALFIGAIVTAFYSQAMVAHLTGQAFTMSQTKDGVGQLPY